MYDSDFGLLFERRRCPLAAWYDAVIDGDGYSVGGDTLSSKQIGERHLGIGLDWIAIDKNFHTIAVIYRSALRENYGL